MSAYAGRPLLGRDDQLQSMGELLNGIHSGGAVVGIIGEPGIGKSALMARAAVDAEALGFTVLRARGCQTEMHLPFASLHLLLQHLLPYVDRLPVTLREALMSCFGMSETGGANPFFTSLAVLELLADAAAQAPLLVCLDDLHWMDQPSIDALSFTARRIASERIVMVCATRSGSLPFVGDEHITLLELGGLSQDASVALLASAAPDLPSALRDRVLAHAGGNPLALVEFASAADLGQRDFDDDLPMTARLERALVARADEADPLTRAVLDVAALDDGEDLNAVLAAAEVLYGGPIDLGSAEPAFSSGLLTLDADGYRIAHPLVGSALRQAMSPSARRDAHAALALALSDDPHRSLWHRASATPGPDERIAAELETAAIDMHRRGAVSTACAWLERSAALSSDPDDRASRLLSAAEYGYELGRFAQVEKIRLQVSALPLRGRERSRLTWLEGAFHDGCTSEPSEILHLVSLARDATGDGDDDLALQLLFGAARRVWWRDPGDSVRGEILSAAKGVPVPASDPRLLAVFGMSESIAMCAVVLDQLALAPEPDSNRPDLSALLGTAAFCVGDHARALAHLSVAVDALRGQGRMGTLAEALAIRAWAEINLGLFGASGSADEAMRLADETGQQVWAATARVAAALIDGVARGADTRSTLLTRAEQTALVMPNASSSLLAGVQLARGIAELGADRPEPAYGELHRVFVPTDPAHQRVQQLWTVSYLADAAVRTGRRDEALALLRSMELLVGTSPALGPAIALDYSRALLADRGSAEQLFLAALDGVAQRFPWHRARVELAYGSWLRRERRVVESRNPLRSARGTFEALRAHAWALRADNELRATGERGWRPLASPQGQLSPQEVHIAQLAARGLSNREIGERLFLSHRTVSSHLHRVFPKLGITSRGQLAEALAGDDRLP